jgi:enamine deaminase RidA (YjgF/YER057c/UK114 family)
MVEISKLSSGTEWEKRHSFSRLVIVDNWIFMAISAGMRPGTGDIPGDPVEQADNIVENISNALQQVGSGLSDIVRLLISIPDRGDILAVQDHVGKRFRGIEPAMTLLCSPLGSDDFKVEIEATAYKGAGAMPQTRLHSGRFGIQE